MLQLHVPLEVRRPGQHRAADRTLGQALVDVVVHRERLPGGEALVAVFALVLLRFHFLLKHFCEIERERKKGEREKENLSKNLFAQNWDF